MSKSIWQGIFIAGLLIASQARAQESDSLALRFHQELNTRTLRLLGGWYGTSSNWTVDSRGRGEITERTLPHYEPQWKTDIGFHLEANRPIANGWTALIESEGQDYHDRAAYYRLDRGANGPFPLTSVLSPTVIRPVTGQNSRISRGLLRAGTQFTPNDAWEVSILAGGAMDRQLEGAGEGFSGQADFQWNDPNTPMTQVGGSGWVNRYGNRRQEETSVRGVTFRTFGDAEDRLTANWLKRRYDLFLGMDNNVVTRVSEETRIDNRLVTPIDPGIWGIYNLGYRRNTIDYQGGGPGQSYELDLINQLALQGRRGPFDGNLSYGYNVEDRKYSGNLFLGRRQILAVNAGWGNSEYDSVRVAATTQKLAFDSPDSLETSDHDRLIHRILMRSVFPVGNSSRLVLEGLVVLDHLVYLKADRSGENRWNRVFRLTPSVEWTPTVGWRNSAGFELLANYTVYDFEQPNSGDIRSSVLRRWSASDTLRVPFNSLQGFETTVRYDLEDRGRLRWQQFQQELSDDIQAIYLSVAYQRMILRNGQINVGYRYQRRIENQYTLNTMGETEKSRARTYLVYGPFFRVNAGGRGPLRLIIDTTLQQVNDSAGSGPSRLDRIDISLAYLW